MTQGAPQPIPYATPLPPDSGRALLVPAILHFALAAFLFAGGVGSLVQALSAPASPFRAAFEHLLLTVAGVELTMGLLISLSGICLLRRRWWVFSIAIAVLVCFGFPFGTALGVYTLIVLARNPVKEAYKLRRIASF